MKRLIQILGVGFLLYVIYIQLARTYRHDKLDSLSRSRTEGTSSHGQTPAEEKVSEEKNGITWPPSDPEGKKVAVAPKLLTKNYYVVFDGSSSMLEQGCSGNESKAAVAKRAVATFATTIPYDANLGLLAFDNRGVTERVYLGQGPENRKQFLNSVQSITPDGSTPLASAIAVASKKLESQARSQLGYGEYHLVVVTDGEASAGEDPLTTVTYLIDKTPLVVHTIGFCIGDNHSLNQPGRTFYQAANNPQELSRGLDDVLAESPAFDVKEFRGGE